MQPLVSLLSRKHFKAKLQDYYFDQSIRLLDWLESQGVECHVLSASADLYVDAAAETTKLPVDQLNGIEVEIQDGIITEKLVYPVTWSHGKTRKLEQIIQRLETEHPEKQVVVLAAFGNSYNTDGPFMKAVAEQRLPAGKPISVMINGGSEPESYQGLFVKVELDRTVSGK